MSEASKLARERRNAELSAAPDLIDPPYDPVDAVNRARRGEGQPAAESDPMNPNGVADVNGEPGTDGGNTSTNGATPLPEELAEDVRAALTSGGFDTVEKVRAASDKELDDLPGIGAALLSKIRTATAEG